MAATSSPTAAHLDLTRVRGSVVRRRQYRHSPIGRSAIVSGFS
jgi:hypothetical protein